MHSAPRLPRSLFLVLVIAFAVVLANAGEAGTAAAAGERLSSIGPEDAIRVGPTIGCGDDIPFADVDGNSRVDPLDALWILKDIAELPLPEGGGGCSSHDVDCDGTASAVDALKILRYAASLPYTQHEPCTNIGSHP
jgi:hypothetical protein